MLSLSNNVGSVIPSLCIISSLYFSNATLNNGITGTILSLVSDFNSVYFLSDLNLTKSSSYISTIWNPRSTCISPKILSKSFHRKPANSLALTPKTNSVKYAIPLYSDNKKLVTAICSSILIISLGFAAFLFGYFNLWTGLVPNKFIISCASSKIILNILTVSLIVLIDNKLLDCLLVSFLDFFFFNVAI